MGPDFDGKVVESTGVNQGTTKLLLVPPETTPVQRNLSFKGWSFESGARAGPRKTGVTHLKWTGGVKFRRGD